MKIISSQEVHKYGVDDEKKERKSPLEKKIKGKPKVNKPICIFYS